MATDDIVTGRGTVEADHGPLRLLMLPLSSVVNVRFWDEPDEADENLRMTIQLCGSTITDEEYRRR